MKMKFFSILDAFKMMYCVSIVIVILFGINAAFAQSQNISKEKLQADLDTLYRTINDIHPNMFTNISKNEFEAQLAKIKASIDSTLTPLEFYNLTDPLVVLLRDGHTVLQLPKNILNDSTRKLLPLIVKITNDSTIIIEYNLSPRKELPPTGAIVKSINGVTAKELIKTGLAYSNGEMMFFRYRSLASMFTPLMLFHYKFETFRIKYTFQNKTDSTTLSGISYDKMLTGNKQEEPRANYSFKIIKDSIGYLNFLSFINLSEFKKFSDSVFQVVKEKRIKNLIIDIRYNGGGNSKLGDELFQYISSVPFQQWGQETIKYSKERHDFYKYHVREYFLPDISDCALNDLIGNKPFGSIETEPPDSLIILRENPLRFTGKVYLLTSNFTFSSASAFAWTFKFFKMGVVVGEETGEPVVNFGDIIYQFLPNTGLQFSVSHKKFYQYGATDNDFHGVIPDLLVPEQNALNSAIGLIMNK
jgi:hypothetical protein